MGHIGGHRAENTHHGNGEDAAPTPTATTGSIERTRKSEVLLPILVVSTLTIQNIAVTSGTFTAESGAKLRKRTSLRLFFTPRSVSSKN